MTLIPPPLVSLLVAALLDFWIGDPWGWLHPVQVMGWVIDHYRQWALRLCQGPQLRKLAGIGLGLLLIIGSGSFSWLLLFVAHRLLGPWAYGLDVIMLASCLAGRSLRAAAEDVLTPWLAEDWVESRSKLKLYVGRDTDQLTAPEMMRAIVETIAENTTDGVMAPLFYAGLGALIPGVGPVPLALAYKAASTLDSMVGYKEDPYTDLGWFSARFEDVLTWLPCRLTVITIGLVSGKLFLVWRVCRRDAPQDPSPNAGWSECAFAAAMGVQLGGANWYRGVLKHKPLLGDPGPSLGPEQVYQSLYLMRYSFVLWLGGILLLGLVVESVAPL